MSSSSISDDGLSAAAIAVADALGTHALAAYAAALPALLLTVTVLWWLSDRYVGAGPSNSPASTLRLALRFGLGFVVVVAAAAFFAALADEVDAGDELAQFDDRVSFAIGRNVSVPTLRAFAAVTHLGDPIVLTTLCIVVAGWLAWRRRRGLAAAWVLALAGNALLNRSLKALFERVRPPHEHGLAEASGWSFPSGHSSGAVVAYGMLAYVLICLLPRRHHLPVLLAAAALIFTTGCSRIFLQVHFFSDVAAGFASGGAWLTVCIVACGWTRHRRRSRAAASSAGAPL